MEKESPSNHVENVNVESHGEEIHVSQSKVNISGTVQLTAGAIVYIPTPTSDPRGLSLTPVLLAYIDRLTIPRSIEHEQMAKGHDLDCHLYM